MTRRERLERRQERRLEWAEARDRKSAAGFDRAHRIADGIPMGQPILIGHHSERHARADSARIHNGMAAGVESMKMAEHHRARADGLAQQLERSIYSDDPDAVEALEAKAADLARERDRRKQINATWRRLKGDHAARLVELVRLGMLTEKEATEHACTFALCPYEKQPFPPYSLTNLGATIRKARERVEEIKRQQQEQQRCEDAGGVVVTRGLDGGYCTVRFAEKPARGVLDALRAAGFWWSRGAWAGKESALPADVVEMERGAVV